MLEKILKNDQNVKYEHYWKKANRWMITLKSGERILRSRYVMALYLKCKDYNLPSKLDIHHINLDPSDDRIENLQLILLNNHSFLHRTVNGLKYGIRRTGNEAEYSRMQKALNPDLYNKYYAKNKSKILKKSREWAIKNKEKVREYNKEWYIKNRKEVSAC